ncbi:MAG: hypothetical protein ACRCZB_07630 [Bacteroidales bacterium]
MRTEIFKDKAAFDARPDKSVNGVSHEFAHINPNYEKDNEFNEACWECYGCTGCKDTEYSIDCVCLYASVRCIACEFCEFCTECINCEDCSWLERCEGLLCENDLKNMYSLDKRTLMQKCIININN